MKRTIGFIILAMTIGIYTQAKADGITWGATSSGTIINISSYPHGEVYDVTMGNSYGTITTIGECGHLKVGESILYKVSSIDPAIETQHIQIVNPQNCVTGINGIWV